MLLVACRLVQNLDAVRAADLVVVCTGPDGAGVSIVAGMVECPVVAVPTSTGYGTAFGGVAPLLAALNSSAPGVTVTNIDSGFGAAMAAWRIMKNAAKVRAAAIPSI
jgi:pyridinium-3,5-biscarboxylic acid mononucleotide synthase